MHIDKKKAVQVFSHLLEAYRLKKYPYDLPQAVPPQVKGNIPSSIEWGSREHACFLLTLCYWMRGGIDSHTATGLLTKVYDYNPELFLPEESSQWTPAYLAALFRSVGLGFNAVEIAHAWIQNGMKIRDQYMSDPRLIFQGVKTYEKACQRIQNTGKCGHHRNGLIGFQEKMVSMLTYFYMDAGIIDRWHFPIPVDFHVLRILFANEVVLAEVSDSNANGFYTKEVLKAVRGLCMWYCKKYRVDPILLCEAVWLYSRLMCANHPGNQSSVGGRQGRKTPVYKAVTWSKPQTKMFEKTCGSCVIAVSCRWCVPSAEYYIRGRLVLRERRDTPFQKHLFSINT